MNEYKTSQGFEQAVKAAAEKTDRPTDIILGEYWRSRLLARLFCVENPGFVLKGGSGILARIPEARLTHDLDLMAPSEFEDSKAIDELVMLVKKDLGDFCRFDLTSASPMQKETDYRHGYNLRFKMHIGTKEVTSLIKVDLVFGCRPTAPIEKIMPKNIEGFPFSDFEYLTYPLVDHVADKVCAIMEKHTKDSESSRVKDLVDLSVIACNESFDLKPLTLALHSEFRMRGISLPKEFKVPDGWNSYPDRYRSLMKVVVLDRQYHDQSLAIELVKGFVDPAFANTQENKTWDPIKRDWATKTYNRNSLQKR